MLALEGDTEGKACSGVTHSQGKPTLGIRQISEMEQEETIQLQG